MVPEAGAMTLDDAIKIIERKDKALRSVKEWLNAYDPTACLNDLVDKALADVLTLPSPAIGMLLTEEISELSCGIYRHYKGGFYLLIGIAQHTESEAVCVVYIPLTGVHQPGPRMRLRPIHNFIDEVIVNGVPIPRFEFVGYEVRSKDAAKGATVTRPGLAV